MMTLLPTRTAFLAGATLLSAAFSLQAEIKLPAIFGDHMVLQEGVKLPIWGTANAGDKVTVALGNATAEATAASDGTWKVEFAPLPKGTAATALTIKSGTDSITYADVLVGDVWVCSGQSNMEFNLGGGTFGFGGAHNAAEAMKKAGDSDLRLFIVPKKIALEPMSDITPLKQPIPPAADATEAAKTAYQNSLAQLAAQGKWLVCTPETAGYFSAVGYFFGADLRAQYKKPIGLIGTYWGGTPAEAWTSIQKLREDPALKVYVDKYEKIRADMPEVEKAYPAKQAAYRTEIDAWNKDVKAPYDIALKAWDEEAKKAKTAGQPIPPRPTLSKPRPRPPVEPNGGPNGSASLFNGMIAPLIPFPIKGAIWYQGESNAGQPTEYRSLFADMIKDWRSRWGVGDFPFFFVQLASFKSGATQNWPFLREAQQMALALPNTGMGTAVDVGDTADIHPIDKADVGHRLALAAQHVAYGDNAVVYSGPMYDKLTIKDGAAHLTFTSKGGGLIIGSAPWVALDGQPLTKDKLIGFTIAGDDNKFLPAEAKIVGDEIVVSAAEVPNPKNVRYGWTNVFEGNLYNKDGLPAPPFRTDSLPYDPIAAGGSPTPTPSPSPAAK